MDKHTARLRHKRLLRMAGVLLVLGVLGVLLILLAAVVPGVQEAAAIVLGAGVGLLALALLFPLLAKLDRLS